MDNKDYEELDELKNRLNNSDLKEAIEILEGELERSNQAIKEGFEKVRP